MKHLTTVIFKAIQAERLLGMLCCFLMLLVSSSTSLLAQGEAANWYFGNGAGISFNSGSPVAFPNSALNAGEGVSSISDAAGNALMYTDGLDLYNRNDVVMPNGAGLLGGSSSSQSAVIIRKPLSNSLYYLFTADQDAEPDGIRYSIVNMALDAGLGDITATKNVLLHAPATEKLTAVMHCNKRDVWIIAHGWGDSDFMAWLLTPAGLSASPVVSSVGTVQNQSVIGCMKVSPDGQKLAFAVFDPSGTDYVQLFDFDPSTGAVSNPATFPSTGNCYGVEFSPNSRYLYYTASVSGSPSNIQILQADLCAGTNTDIISSEVSVGASTNGFIRSLQLGPDGKLYFARFFQNEIGVIDFPDLPAPACGFNVSGVTLSPGAQCKAGLPNFNQSFFKNTTPFNVSQSCLTATFDANSISQSASCNNPIQSYSWNFGEPSSGASNTSSLQQVAHTYAAPGTYHVRLIVQYFCRADTLLQSIDVNCGPQVQVNSGSVCSGTCFTLQATAAGGTPPYTYSWNNGLGSSAGPIQVCPTSTTQYIVTLTDATGQTSKDTSIVTVSSVPLPTVVNQSPSCHGATNGSVTITLSGGPFTYQWAGYPNQTGATLTGLPTGNYSAIISNALGCQQAVSSTLGEPALLTATVATINSACSTANGSASVTASGGTAPYTYNWVGFSPAAATHSILPVGSFNVIVTDAHGCSVNEPYTISTLPAPFISIQELNPITCHAGANGALGLQISGGQPPYQYQWSNGGNTANINGLSAGTYTISVNDANGCMAIDSYTLTEPVAISLTVTPQTANCGLSNGSASAMVSGAFSPISINWTSSPIQTGNTASNLAAGNYSATITDAHGCSASTSFSIGNTPGPIVSSYGTPVSCFGANDGTASVSVITGTAYQVTWSNGQTGTQITGLAPGTYTATVSTSTGCISTSSYTVGSPSAIALSMTASSSTCGTSNGSVTATVNGGLGPYTYVWTGFPAQSSSVLSNLSAGSYSLQVSDANGCTTNGNATVSSQNGPSIQVVSQQDAACFGASNGSASVAVSGGVAPIAISWSNGATGTTATGLLAGNYIVTAVDAIGCTAVSTILIGQPAALLATYTNTNASCGLANGTATLNVNGGTAPYSYSWSNGSMASSIMAMSGNYSVQVTDAQACSVSVIASISSASALSVSIIGITQVSCYQGNDAALQANVSGGTAPYTYHWSNNATGSALNGVPAGNYTVTITDASSCSATASVQVTEPSAWNVSSSIGSSTCGNPNGSVHLSPSGASAPYSIVWSTGATGTQLNNVPAGIYSVTISDGNGCVFNNFYQVADAGGLSLNVINQTNALCAGAANGSVSVQAIGGTSPYSYSWSDGGTGASRSTLIAGNYTVTVQDVNGCQASTSITLSEAAALIGTITSSPSSCGFANGTAQAIITGGTQPYVYSWDNGSQLSSCSGLLAGNINLNVTDANGCLFSSSVIIGSAAPLAVAIVQTDWVTCPSDANAAVQAAVNGGTAPYSYAWSDGSSLPVLTGISAGNYSLVVNDANGCSASASIQISAPAAWNVSASIQSSTCGSPNGAIQLNISGASAPYSALWSNGVTTPSLTAVASGIYSVTLSDANQCVHTAYYQVNDAGGLSLNVISQTDALCAGASNGTASVQAIGGTSPYVYVWEDGSALPQNTALAAGDYVVSVTDMNGCVAVADVHIQEAAPLQISLNVSDGTCGLNNAAASVSVSGGTAPYSYIWTNGALTSSVAGLSAGSIGVQVTDAHACSSSSSASVAIAAALQASVAILQGVSCYGNADALVEIQGSSALQAQWSNGQTGLQANHLVAGNYSVIGIDAGACSDTVNFTISEPAALQVQLSVQDATCSQANGSASVQVIGGTLPYTYSWSNGVNTAVNSALPAGQITLDITDANGCSMHDAAQVQSIQLLHIDSFQLSPVSCYGLSDGTAQAMVSGAVGNLSYAWSSGGNANQASGLAAGNYSLLLEDTAGCSQTASFTISAPAALQVSIQTTNVSCAGGANGTASATVNGGVAPYQYAWDGLSSNSTFTAGTHTLLVNDANGCAVASNFQINEPSALTLQLTAQTPRCGLANGSISTLVAGGTSPYSYQWNTGATLANLSLVGNGNYTATVIDANGCSAQQSQVFADPGAPVLQLNAASNISCAGLSDGAISVSTTGGTGAYAYTWSNPNLAGTNITTLFAGNYSVEVHDELLCRDTLTITLTEPQALLLSLSAQAVTCAGGSNGLVDAQVSGGTAPYSYVWSNATSAAQLSQVAAGNYSLTLIDAHACSISANVEVAEPLPLSGSITSHSVICYGEASGWAEVTVNGGVAPYTYSWSSGATDSVENSLSAGIHQVIIRDANACLLSLQTEVLQPEALHVNFTGIDKLCFGDSALLMASSTGGVQPYSYFWNAQAGDESYLWHADSTHYELLLAIDANGCRDSIKRELLVYALPQAGISFAEREICAGECVTLTAMSVDGGVYSWSDSRQAIQNGQSVSFCYEDSGAVNMQLQVSDVHGCSSTWQQDSFIEVHPLPVVGFSPNHMSIPLLDALVYFENTSAGAVSYQWDFNPRSSGEESAVNNPYFQFTEVGDYPVTLTAINEYGCASSLERTITVTKDFAVYFPNAFTPNADGMNDRFMPSGTGIDTDQFSMQIFNRWGQLVYETSTWGQGWDGTFLSQQGIKEDAGAELFVWQMLITDFKGLMHDYRGSVMLVR